MEFRRFTWLIASLLFTALFAAQMVGQSIVTGDLTGVVTDQSSAVVPNAPVTLRNMSNGESQTTQTNGQGQYRFTFLKPGTYMLSVKAAGLATTEVRTDVRLGEVTSVPVKLGVAGVATTVEVVAQTPLIETENANISTNYSSTQLSLLPTPGNDITSYAYSAPGVVLNSAAGYGNFSSFGLPSTSNLFTTNGNDNMDPYLNLNNSGASNLSLGANELDQIAVVSNGYTAQYGRQAGAQVNASTKSGSNSFHGNAEYWWNGRTLNANDWFGNFTKSPRPFANNNQWAASFGGPIKRDKAFFFADTEGLRFALPGVSGLNFLPSPQFASYVLANVNTTTPGSLPFYQKIFSLYAGSPGAGRATPVPASSDPTLGCSDFAAAGFGTTLPCSVQFVSIQNNINTEWLLSTRLDYNFSNNDRLFGRFKTDHGLQATGTDPVNSVFNADSIQPEWEGQINHTHIFNGTTVNQFILSGMWYSALFTADNLPKALQTFPTTILFAANTWANMGGTDYNFPQGRIVSQYEMVDDFSKTVGSHDLKFGVNFRRNLVSDYTTGVNTSGQLTINSMTEFVNGTSAGASDFSKTFANVGAVRIKLYNVGFYAQDQWKATSKLAVTAAVRVDRTSNPRCGSHCFSRLIAPFAQISHDDTIPYNQIIRTGVQDAFPSIEKVVLAPRLGLAWNVKPNTVLRGGVGVFSDLFPAFIADRLIVNAPNVSTFDANTGPFSPDVAGNLFALDAASNAAFRSGFASGQTFAQLQASVPGFSSPTYNSVPNKLLNPKFLEWNFELEQKLGNSYSVDLNYVGNHGYDVMTDNPFKNAFCKANCPFGGIGTTFDDRFAQVREITNNGWSNYHGLTTSFKFRAKSLQAQVNYTWAHALDTCSNNCLLPFVFNTLVSIRYQTSPFLPGTAYGSADYDVRHNVNANYIYTTKENWSNSFLREALGGWSIAGTVFFHSGYPYSVVNSRTRSNLGNVTGLRTTTPLADFLGGPVAAGNCSSPNTPCVTQSEFLAGASQADFGNLARNSFRGAGFFDTDLNVTKNFKLGERVGFAIGANFFNILNHPNFDLPLNNAKSGNVGTIVATVSPATSPYGAFLSVPLTGRIVQVNARFTF